MALTIGTVTNVSNLAESYRLCISVPITASAAAATAVTALTGTVNGLQTNMVLTVNGPTPTVNSYCIGGNVSAANTLQLIFVNPTDASVTPDAGIFLITA